jgi:hypothetical protein
MVLSIISSLAGLICWIIVLTKLFPAEGVGLGILAIICGLYAFIWGWQNRLEHGLENTMTIWTVSWLAGIVLSCSVSYSA